MKILVIGGTGVVGRRLLPLLVAPGHQVTAVVRSASRSAQVERSGVLPRVVDIFDPRAVIEAVTGHDTIINVATRIPPSSKAFFPRAFKENDRIRREASRNLVSAALEHRVSRFIQESITLVYPDSGDQWIDENVPLDLPAYAATVTDAEAQTARFTAGGGTGVVLRFALFYGPDSSHTIDTVNFVRKGKAPTFGSRDAYISSISTDDAASAVVAALEINAGVYNVTDDRPVTRLEYFNSLARALGVRDPWLPPAWIKHLAGSIGKTMARSQRVSNRRFKPASGWHPRYPSVTDAWPDVLAAMRTQ